MIIGLIIYGPLSTLSGGYLYDRKLVEFFAQQGDQVEIISLPWRNYLRHLGDNLSARLQRRLERLHVDVLLEDELNHPSLFWLNHRLRRRVNFPLVSIVHHLRSSELRPRWQNRFYSLIERCYLASLDGFVFNSDATRRAVHKLLGCKNCPPWVIAYPAGDHLQGESTEEEIERRAWEPGVLRLIFVGNLIPRKNLHLLIEALARIKDRQWELSVVGSAEMDEPYAQFIRRKVSLAGLSDQIHFLGRLDESALTTLLRQSHLLVAPSSYEGFGIVYLEGMRFGLPAIASTAGAAGEIITHGENGFLVDPDDPQALADLLSIFLQDRARLASMGKIALRRSLQHPTWSESAASIRSFLQTLT